VTPKKVFKLWGLRIYIQATAVAPQPGTVQRPHQTAFKSVHETFAQTLVPGKTTKVMDWNTYSCALKRIYFPIDWIRSMLSTALGELVHLPSYVVLDEKLKRYTGNSPCLRKILSKPDQIGHWVSEVCVRLATTELPFCVGLFPVTSCKREQKQQVSSIVEWATTGMKHGLDQRRHVLVADSYYLDRIGRKTLLEEGIPFLVAVNPARFRPLVERLPISKVGKWHALYNETTRELFIHIFDVELGHKYLLTNCLSKTTLKANNERAGWNQYKYAFNVCDTLNKAMTGHYYPFARRQWELGIDDLSFTVVLFSVYNLWKTHVGATAANVSWQAAMKDLGLELYRHALSL